MAESPGYDVFLSHSSKDKPNVRPIAERLRADGLRVWFDEWEIAPGDSIPRKIDEGLERSRVLVLCMSRHAFESEWVRLESNTFRFRDPLNKERRFVPLRLDDAPIKGSLAQFQHIKWSHEEYLKLLEACRPPRRRLLCRRSPSKGFRRRSSPSVRLRPQLRSHSAPMISAPFPDRSTVSSGSGRSRAGIASEPSK